MQFANHNQKWAILALVVITNMLTTAIPTMAISVLSQEIAQDLRLDLVQVGVIWGAGALLGIPTAFLGGAIGDRIGPRKVLAVGTLAAGLLGLARGFATDFFSLSVLNIAMGGVAPVVLMNGIKTAGMWFPRKQLGLANGINSMGMALGFMIGSLVSATVLSPMLGGWRNVLIAYGVLAALCSIAWFFAPNPPGQPTKNTSSILRALAHVASLRNIWLLGLAITGISGAIQGTLGYLPLYLRNAGWPPLQADGALSAFHTVSMFFVMPVVALSDRLGSRKGPALVATLLMSLGIGGMAFATGASVWVAVIVAGCVRDAFMAIYMTMIIETEGVGPAYAGTATGFNIALAGVGNLLAPPLGNSLASIHPGAPFWLWSALALAGFTSLLFFRDARPAA